MEEHGEIRNRRAFREDSCTHAGGDFNDLHSDIACSRGPCHTRSHAPADELTSSRRRPGLGVRNWGIWETYFCKTSSPSLDDSHSARQCQSLQTSRIRQLSESCSAPPAREHLSENRARNAQLSLASAEEPILQQNTSRSQSPSCQACSCSSRGSGSFVSFLLAVFLLFLSTLAPTAMAAVANVKLVPSGVLEMTVSWTDSPQIGAT